MSVMLKLYEMDAKDACRIIRAKAKGLIKSPLTEDSLGRVLKIEITKDGMFKLEGRIIGKVEERQEVEGG
jgi:hypothetical protein